VARCERKVATISRKEGSWEWMKEVFWTRELAWLCVPTPRVVAEGVFVRKEKEWVCGCCMSLSVLEDDVAGGDAETSGRS
jgi:hypothetical protein